MRDAALVIWNELGIPKKSRINSSEEVDQLGKLGTSHHEMRGCQASCKLNYFGRRLLDVPKSVFAYYTKWSYFTGSQFSGSDIK
jgi:hypothetical protein